MDTVAPLTERLELTADLIAVEFDDGDDLAALIMEARDALVAIRQHYELRSELYTSDADLAAAMYQLATGSASAQAAENTEERGNG